MTFLKLPNSLLSVFFMRWSTLISATFARSSESHSPRCTLLSSNSGFTPPICRSEFMRVSLSSFVPNRLTMVFFTQYSTEYIFAKYAYSSIMPCISWMVFVRLRASSATMILPYLFFLSFRPSPLHCISLYRGEL